MIFSKTLLRRHTVLPGFDLALGLTLLYLCLIVLIPLSATFLRSTSLTWPEFVEVVTSPRVVASYKLTFGSSLLAAAINAFFGLLVAWVLVRYQFVGRRLVDALVDLPFALPTAVAGITLTGLYSSNGWIGQWLEGVGVKVAFTPAGVFVAMTFIGLPFVVRTVQPILEDLSAELEEAAATLGAAGRACSLRRLSYQARRLGSTRFATSDPLRVAVTLGFSSLRSSRCSDSGLDASSRILARSARLRLII